MAKMKGANTRSHGMVGGSESFIPNKIAKAVRLHRVMQPSTDRHFILLDLGKGMKMKNENEESLDRQQTKKAHLFSPHFSLSLFCSR